MTKMTKTEKFEMIIAELTKTGDITEDTAMLVEFCKDEIAAIADKAEKAKARRAAKAKEADELYDAVLTVLNDTTEGSYLTINSIIDTIDPSGESDLTPSKITPRLTKMVTDGIVEKKSIKTEDKRRLNGYAIVRG